MDKDRRMRILQLLVSVILVTASASAFAYGPFDYTNPIHVRDKLPIVEKWHFNADVEGLTGTMAGGDIGGHLWYVIRSFPNHHRALSSMARLWRQHMPKNQIPAGVEPHRTPEVLFERAIAFAPHDGMVRLLYGSHLHRIGELDKALDFYEQAEKLKPDSPELHYNLGLLYTDIKSYDKAKEHAIRAYSYNYPLPGLKKKLIAAGVWSE
ncbi:MAG: tetratricopeptide repeat protein [Gammaproteobacteria bacterium]